MHPGPDQDTSRTTPRQRLTVADAATLLGVSQDAIRKRVARNSIEHEKSEDGRLFVYLYPSETREAADQDASKTALDIMQDQVEYLRRQLEVWQEEARRKDHIIMSLTQRIPELELAPGEPREFDISASEERGEGDAPRSRRSAVRGYIGSSSGREGVVAERSKGFWRRVFGR